MVFKNTIQINEQLFSKYFPVPAQKKARSITNRLIHRYSPVHHLKDGLTPHIGNAVALFNWASSNVYKDTNFPAREQGFRNLVEW